MRRALTIALAVDAVWCYRTPDTGGDFLHALGGTLFQLIVPFAFIVYFWRRGEFHSATVPLWWVGQNCWNIARYVADARAQELPLVGGGEHDWAYLLAELDRLPQDERIGQVIRVIGALIAGLSVILGWYAASRRPANDPRQQAAA